MMTIYQKTRIMSGKDKGYSKTYKISQEFSIGSANRKTYFYPEYDSKNSRLLATKESEFSMVYEVMHESVLFSEYNNGRFTLNVYDAKKDDYKEQYILNELGGIFGISWQDEICLIKWTNEANTSITACVINFRNNNLLWKKELVDFGDTHVPKLNQHYTIACTYGDEQLFALDTLTGLELWRHDYTELGRYADVLQRTLTGCVFDFKFWQDSVIVYTSGSYLLRVDLVTGRTHWLLQVPHSSGQFIFDGDQIHLFKHSVYYVVDAYTGSVLREHYIDTLAWPAKYGYMSYMAGHAVDEEFIYITGQGNQKVLVIDKQQWELVQILDISEGKGSPAWSSPLLAGNKLCQVDGQSDLHVFERVA